ncbi:hypothetical protein niasHT_036169 [Heterodera trifolii]|uniref:Innexin n=1 Tax=Heterodera trifolii TaxID=157864 RepID=A0ABD2IIM3_9BILA
MFVFFAVLTTAFIFGVGGYEPMKCLHSSKSKIDHFGFNVCEVLNEDGTSQSNQPNNSAIFFYEFLPVMLLIQAALFYLPKWTQDKLLQKSCLLANAVAQFAVVNALTCRGHRWWGIEMGKSLLSGDEIQDLPIFPRLITCDSVLAPNVFIQCHLRITWFNEKIFFVIWWSLLCVSLLTLITFVSAFIRSLCNWSNSPHKCAKDEAKCV